MYIYANWLRIIAKLLLTHADSSGGVRFSPTFVCLSGFPHYISKPDAARITKLDREMFHDESWKPGYYWGQRSRSRVTKCCRHGSLHSCECWLPLVLFTAFVIYYCIVIIWWIKTWLKDCRDVLQPHRVSSWNTSRTFRWEHNDFLPPVCSPVSPFNPRGLDYCNSGTCTRVTILSYYSSI